MWHRVFTFLSLSLIPGFAAFSTSMAEGEPHSLVSVQNLQTLAEQARQRRLPIMLMMSRDSCPYCRIMEEDYLRPMLRSGRYVNKIIIRKLETDKTSPLTDFDGGSVTAQQLQKRYNSSVTPTLIFLNDKGKEISAPLVGVGTEGLFNKDIDDAIDKALTILRSETGKPPN